ncbi:unnamed protein product [Paramecium sonneborni]|uniref:NADH dehydrogenase subunit 11 n=1 Tax=Paramecium sonneborni TaxID=65129 RepID=A0A8S1MNM7_9CILI|nr:unnamed protein product [Paramecium sonneborni]
MIRFSLKKGQQLLKKQFQAFSTQQNLIEIFIDDVPHKVDPSATIFQACYSAGVIIPRFCYHERLAVAGNCRMCLVEVEKSPKPVAACAAQVAPGMRILTKSEKTRIARGGVMEFLLANHPLDCPICDQGGECDLQDISEQYGYGDSRHNEYKRAVEDKNFGPLVATSMNRCIHCTRCIRFSDEYAGVTELGTSGRGRNTEIGTYIDKMITSELQGNLADICPVGALTNGPYAFTSRPWELKSYDSVDVFDTIIPLIQIDTRGAEIMRVLPRIHEEVNEEWLNDKSRQAFDGLKKQRLTLPLARDAQGNFTDLYWPEAIQQAAKKLQSVKGEEIVGVIGEFADCESIVALKDLLNRFDSDNFEIRGTGVPQLDADFRANYLLNSRITGVEEADVLLLVGTNPKVESPLLNSRILRATRKNNLKVFLIGPANDLTYNYVHLGNNASILDEIANGSHPFAGRLKSAKLPMILTGAGVLERTDGNAIHNALKKIAQNSAVINPQQGWNGFNLLHKEVGRINALELGITARRSSVTPKVVILLGVDNNLNAQDIPKDAYVIYIGSHGDEGAYYADLILPGATYTEKNGTYVSTEGRVQTTKLVALPPSGAKSDWEILRALSEECGCALPYDTLEEVRYRIAELAPHLLKYDYIEPSVLGQIALKPESSKQTISATPFRDLIDNFYMTDAISRQSVTMAKCSTAFNPHKFSTFKQL